MEKIMFKDIKGDNIEMFRELCNSLFQYQASVASIRPDILASMSFDTRMVPAYKNAKEKQLLVAYDGNQPIGFILSTASMVSKDARNGKPKWSVEFKEDEQQGFYSDSLVLPAKIGSLNLLYVKPEYRNRHIGAKLCEGALKWFCEVEGIEHVLVNVSNGNSKTEKFYEKFGLKFSHNVYGGFIKTYYLASL